MRKIFSLLLLVCLWTGLTLPVYAQSDMPQDMTWTLDSENQLGFMADSSVLETEASMLLAANTQGVKAPIGPVWLLSALIPGLGQVVMGHPTRGYFFLLANALAFPVGFLTGLLAGLFGDQGAGLAVGLVLLVGGSLQAVAYVWNLYDANQLYVKQLLEAQKQQMQGYHLDKKTVSYWPVLRYQGQF